MNPRFTPPVFVLLLAACSGAASTAPPPGSPPSPDVPPRFPAEATAPVERVSRTWSLAPDDGVRGYSFSSRAVVGLVSGDSGAGGAVDDTVEATGSYSISIARILPAVSRFSGSLESFTIRSARSHDPSPPFELPLAFAGRLDGASVVLDSLRGAPSPIVPDCTPSAGAVASLHRNLVVPPLILAPGTGWRDSTTAVACAGTVPVDVVSLRSYRVVGESSTGGRPTLLIARSDTTWSRGEGAQGQHHVVVTTAGTGTARLHLDRTTGMLVSLEIENESEVEVESSGRRQRFAQRARETLNLTHGGN